MMLLGMAIVVWKLSESFPTAQSCFAFLGGLLEEEGPAPTAPLRSPQQLSITDGECGRMPDPGAGLRASSHEQQPRSPISSSSLSAGGSGPDGSLGEVGLWAPKRVGAGSQHPVAMARPL